MQNSLNLETWNSIKGDIERRITIDDNASDVVISNCVINS
jgi:hypothetical protein